MNFYSNLLCAINLLSKTIEQIIKRKKVENIEAAKLLAVSNPMPPIFEDQPTICFSKKNYFDLWCRIKWFNIFLSLVLIYFLSLVLIYSF